MDNGGNQVTNLVEMKLQMIEYFTTLYYCPAYSRPILDLSITFLKSMSHESNAYLRQFPCLEEIRSTLFNMVCGKAPGPDGLLGNDSPSRTYLAVADNFYPKTPD